MDGTFYVVPSMFSQLYTMHVMIGGSMISCAYFLLPAKTKETYIDMFQLLQQRCSLSASRFQIDFEMATVKAVQQLFPNALVSGCFFHYTQCIWRKVQAIGLASQYNRGMSVVQKVVRRLAGLPLLKLTDVQEGFYSIELLVAILPPDSQIDQLEEQYDERVKDKLNQLLVYVKRTWVNETATFPKEIWSRYGVQGPRTNNHVEGWNNRIKKAIKSAHPNFFVFVNEIKKEQKRIELKLLQLTTGGKVAAQKTKWARLEAPIQSRVNDYNLNPFVSLWVL